MAYQTKEVFDLMSKESGLKIKSLAVDGGLAIIIFFMQFQADMLDIPIVRPSIVDSTVAGAAYLAGVSIGLWKPQDVLKVKTIERTFRPHATKGPPGWMQRLAPSRAPGISTIEFESVERPPVIRDISRLSKSKYDLIVVGGGINGATMCAPRELACGISCRFVGKG